MPIAKQFGTNWFTTVMGIGIVAALTYTSPVSFPLHKTLGIVLFVVLNIWFVISLGFWLTRWVRHTRDALEDFHHPNRALFYGALAMAINVTGNDYFLIGQHLMTAGAAIAASQAIWVAGTAVSLFTVFVVPYLLFTVHEVTTKDALASWLIPVVPPIVAAATGTNLIPFWGSPAAQFAVTALILAMFGMTLFLFLMVSALVYFRLVYHKRIEGEFAPSVWVEIGPIGMSMATLSTLPFTAHGLFGAWDAGLRAVGLIASSAMWGVGLWWIVIAAVYSLHHLTRRGDGIKYTLGWWSYVFPIGSFTSGTYALNHLVGGGFFAAAGLVQLVILWGCFLIVSWRTARHTMDGTLFHAGPAAGAPRIARTDMNASA